MLSNNGRGIRPTKPDTGPLIFFVLNLNLKSLRGIILLLGHGRHSIIRQASHKQEAELSWSELCTAQCQLFWQIFHDPQLKEWIRFTLLTTCTDVISPLLVCQEYQIRITYSQLNTQYWLDNRFFQLAWDSLSAKQSQPDISWWPAPHYSR